VRFGTALESRRVDSPARLDCPLAGFEISSLRYCINPVRYGYFKARLRELSLPGKSVLDIGCGGGFLAEEFARDGFDVSGIDPAGNSVRAARAHAAEPPAHPLLRRTRGIASVCR